MKIEINHDNLTVTIPFGLRWEDIPVQYRPHTIDIGEGTAGEDYVNAPTPIKGLMSTEDIYNYVNKALTKNAL